MSPPLDHMMSTVTSRGIDVFLPMAICSARPESPICQSYWSYQAIAARVSRSNSASWSQRMLVQLVVNQRKRGGDRHAPAIGLDDLGEPGEDLHARPDGRLGEVDGGDVAELLDRAGKPRAQARLGTLGGR